MTFMGLLFQLVMILSATPTLAQQPQEVVLADLTAVFLLFLQLTVFLAVKPTLHHTSSEMS